MTNALQSQQEHLACYTDFLHDSFSRCLFTFLIEISSFVSTLHVFYSFADYILDNSLHSLSFLNLFLLVSILCSFHSWFWLFDFFFSKTFTTTLLILCSQYKPKERWWFSSAQWVFRIWNTGNTSCKFATNFIHEKKKLLKIVHSHVYRQTNQK